MTCEVKIIADSRSPEGVRLTTFQLKYWRAIHAEVMTHRVFSRNAASSRAIPVMKVISQVWHDPAGPVHWGANQPGMQARGELTDIRLKLAKGLWRLAAKAACVIAWGFTKVGLHKQVANRVLEPFQYMQVILSATDIDKGNFFDLRAHKDAQPEIQELACEMEDKYIQSSPRFVNFGEAHLPYVTANEIQYHGIDMCKKFSTARNARVSYLTHDGQTPDVKKDLGLYDRLVGSVPIHASPAEHVAQPDAKLQNGDWANPHLHGNFTGWIQHRKEVELHIKQHGAVSK